MADLYGRFDYKERADGTFHIYHAHEDGWQFTWAKTSSAITVKKAWGGSPVTSIPVDPEKWSKAEFRAVLSKWFDNEADSCR